MEILLAIVGLLFALSITFEKATQFIKSLKSNGSAKLNNGFQVSLSIEPIEKKWEHVLPTQNSTNDFRE